MDIGRMNKRISFYKEVSVDNELGQSTIKLEKVKTVWASLEPTRGREYQEAQRLRPELTYKIYTRYFDFVDQDTIVKHNGKYYEIQSVADVRSNHRMLEIYATEYTKQGYEEVTPEEEEPEEPTTTEEPLEEEPIEDE